MSTSRVAKSSVTLDGFISFVEVALRDLPTASPLAEVLASSHLVDDLGLDSFDVVVLLHEIETNFGAPLAQITEPTIGGLFGAVRGNLR